ncbi:PssE/Cps14G family polysaccharide biosynthesis glycosyltransferase [Jeotgalibacillus salarius]|uniref:Exopolysaccharide biosynthesis protein n=1 Tax=Jeotgalibacillus salarius TaxID=546023 RepID=A0A4Y8LN15_9BACL|nr:PssE/Cps14G family polysaccharide biosynthesis glycosyltransferase [Jeotgalibacillus salarius]TFE03980.1 exopolysaccharide biosynthesis protein [Jeotgalibacillus salarius]
MIFIVLGTHELPFKRLLEQIELQIKSGQIEEEVIVQSGHTSFKTKNMKMIPFMSYKEMEEMYDKANLIITHGGTGSITTGIKIGKKMIAVPRLKKYGEHNDDHQLEIVGQFFESGHILQWNEAQEFNEVLQQVRTFEPKPFESGRVKILSILEEFIDDHA